MASPYTDQTQPGGQLFNPFAPGGQAPNPASPTTVNYGTVPANFDYSRISALAPSPGATPFQTFQNIDQNYHAADRQDVMQAANAWLQAGGQAPPAPAVAAANPNPGGAATSGAPDYTSPQGQLAAVQSWLSAGPNQAWASQAQYFTDRINQTGGFTPSNIAYWQNMIQQGQTPDQAAAASGQGAPASVPSAPTGMNDPNATALFNTLMGIANESQVVNPNDPTVAAQTNAYGAQQTKAARDAQTAVAEGSSGSYDSTGAQARSLQETAGTNTSAFQASVMANELAARRTQIEDALSGASGLLTAEQQMSLNEELTKLQQAQQLLEFQQSQAQQNTQFGQTLAQNAYQYDTTTNDSNQISLSS